MARGIPQPLGVRLPPDDRQPVRCAGPEPGPAAGGGHPGQGGHQQSGTVREDGHPFVRRGGIEPGMFHRGAADCLAIALEQIASAAEEVDAIGLPRPGEGHHLPAHRLHRHRPRQVGDPSGPRASRQDDVAGGVPLPPADADHPPAAPLQARHLILEEADTQVPGIGPQGVHQSLRMQRPVVRRPEGAMRRAHPGPALTNLRVVQPVADVALLPLPRHLGAQLLGARLRLRQLQAAPLVEPDGDPGAGAEGFGQPLVEAPPGQPQVEQRVILPGLDLGGQQPGRGPPGFALAAAALQHRHLTARQRQRPGARGPDDSSTHHKHIMIDRHLDLDETF